LDCVTDCDWDGKGKGMVKWLEGSWKEVESVIFDDAVEGQGIMWVVLFPSICKRWSLVI